MLVILLSYLMIFCVPFNWFVYYGTEYKFVEPIATAIEERDADAFTDMLSDYLIEEYPDIEDGIEEIFNSIEGEITEVRSGGDSFTSGDLLGTTCYKRLYYVITTTETTAEIAVSCCTMSLLDKKEIGINRIVFSRITDENISWLADPDLYFTTGADRDVQTTRVLNKTKSGVADDQLFYILGGDTYNANCFIHTEHTTHNREEDWVKIWLIPEGEEMTEERRENPTYTYIAENGHYMKTKIPSGKYYLYSESNNPDLIYRLTIETEM